MNATDADELSKLTEINETQKVLKAQHNAYIMLSSKMLDDPDEEAREILADYANLYARAKEHLEKKDTEI